MIIVNAENHIVGRMATHIAKIALEGNDVRILNCDKAIISGQKKQILASYKQKKGRTQHVKGPFIPRVADRFVRRVIRGMLPYKQPRGRDAFKRVMCYIGVPEEFKDKDMITYKDADAGKLPKVQYVSIKQICEFMGGK